MFIQKPHFNQYFPINPRTNTHLHSNQKTQQKIYFQNHSQKSHSQESLSHAQHLNNNNKNTSKKYLQTKHSHTNQKNLYESSSPQSVKQLNILDQFKLKKPSQIQFIKSRDFPINTYTSAQKPSKDFHKQTHNLYTSTSPKILFTGEYFVNSLNYKNHQDKNRNKTRSKDKSISHRSKKSPLRKIVKSQSHQMLYDPIQRVFKVIKQEQKARQQQKLNQRTLKHLNFIPTFSELNNSFLDLAKNIKEVKSQRNLNQIKSLQNKKSNHDLVLSRQYLDFDQKKVKKQEEFNRNRIKKTKSVQVMNYAVTHKNLGLKISSSKVKDYFSRKQLNLKKHEKIRYLLEDMGKIPNQQGKLRKVHSENQISQISLSQPSQLSNSNDLSNRRPVKNKIQLEPYQYSHSGESQNYKSSHDYEHSDYGFQMQSNPSQKSMKGKGFNKTSQKLQKEIPLDLKNMKMYVVDEKERHKAPQPQQNYSQSQSINSYENSTPSIQEYIHSKQPSVQNSSYVSSKKSVHSKTQNAHLSQSSNSDYQPVESINTPAYRNGIRKQTKRSIIINEVKEDRLKQNDKSLSVSSNMSKNQLIEIDSKINKESSHVSNKRSNQFKDGINPYLKAPKIQSSSIINDLSNLIDDSSNHNLYNENEKKPSIKTEQIQIQKKSNMTNNGKMKTTPKLSTVKDHEFSEFQMIKQSEKDLTQGPKDQKRNDTQIQNSNGSDLGLKSKRSIIYEESLGQKSNQIPLNSSISNKGFKKSIGFQNTSEKKEESKKVIKFLKITNKKNETLHESVKIGNSVKQQQSEIKSEQVRSLQTKRLQQSVSSRRSKGNDQKSKQNIRGAKQSSISNKSAESNQSIEGSQSSQSESKTSQDQSSNSNSYKKRQEQSKRNNEYSDSSYSESSYSRTLTKSITNNLSKASSPNNISKSSIHNQNFKLHLNSKDSHSQSMVDSSYNNNSSQTSLSNSTSNNILKHSANKVDLSKKDGSSMFKKKKNFAQYTLNDVARLVQEHQFRIQAYCLYVDNSKSIYEQDYQLQKIQLLSFLMLKKSVYELIRAINALNGQGPNVFYLTDIEILDEAFEEYRQRQQIIQQRDNMIKSKKQTFQELKQTFLSLQKKYTGEKGFNLTLKRDDMSSQIVKKLSQQLNLLYQKWEQNKSNDYQLPKITKKLQKRMMEIIQLIFLTSELDGQKVKGCELFTDTQNDMDFRSYYEKWFQKIIETIQYFDGRKSTNEEH